MKVNTNINGTSQKKPSQTRQSFFEQILSTNPVPNLICLLDGSINFANEAAQILFGYDSFHLYQQNIREVFFKENKPNSFQDLMEQKCQPLNLQVQNSEGRIVHVEVYSNKYFEDGLQKINISFFDVSSKIEIALQAKEHETNLHLFLENSEELIMIVDTNYQIRLFNKSFAQHLLERMGIKAKEGLSVLEICPEKERDLIKSYYDKAFAGESSTFEIEIALYGKPHVYYCSFKPIKNKEGNIHLVLRTIIDITEKRKQQDGLLLSEQRWRFALESANQGVWDWNIETGEIYFSPSWKKMLGYEKDEIVNFSEWEPLLHPDNREKMLNDIATHLASKVAFYETELKLKAKSGSYKSLLSRGMIIEWSETGAPVRMIGTNTDITEIKSIEENYKLLFYNNPLPMWTVDRNTNKFLEVNDAAIEHYGYTREEFAGMTIFDIRMEEGKQELEQLINNDTDYDKIGKRIWQHKKKNGELIFAAIRGNVFTSHGKKINLILAEDVTDKLLAEQKLKESEAQYKLLFENNPLPFCIYDPATLDFLEVNTAALNFYGYTKEEFFSLKLFDLYLPEELKSIRSVISKENPLGEIVVNTWVQKRKDGKLVTVEVSRTELQYHFIPARLVVIKDITEQVGAKKLLEQSEQQYRSLFQNNPLPCLIYSPLDFCVLEVNDVMVNSYGYSKEELLSMKLFDFIPKSDHKLLQATVKGKDELNSPVVTHWTHLKKNGEKMIVEVIRNAMEYHNLPARLVIIKDVTEKVTIERQLKESNERYNFATKATSDIIWDWDVETGKILWSDNYQKSTGWILPANKCLGLDSCLQKFHPNDKERVHEKLMAVLNDPTQIIWQDEFRYLKADGLYSHVKDRGFIVRDDEGVAVRVIGAMQDITGIKEKEEELLEINERYLLTTQATFDVVWDYDLVTCELEWNDNIQHVFGWQKEDVTFARWKELIHENDRERVINSFSGCVEVEDINNWKEEYLFEKSDGTYRIVLDRGIIVRDNGKKALRIIGAMQDITEIKEKEQELAISNERFLLATKATADIVYDWNLITNELEWNENVFSILGWEKEEITIEMWQELIHENEREDVLKSLLDFVENTAQNHWRKEYHFKSASGEYKYILDRGFLLRCNEGKPVRMIGSMQDITQIKQKEKELATSNELLSFVSQSTSDVIWDWNLATDEISLSENYSKVFGWELPLDRVISSKIAFDRFFPADKQKAAKLIETLVTSTEKKIWEAEFRYLRSDGSFAFIVDRGIIIRDEKGVATRIIRATQDISDRKYSEDLQSLELRVFEVSAIPGIHFHAALKTLINGYESLHSGLRCSISLLNINDEIEILAPKLTKENGRRLKYFIEKQKDKLLVQPAVEKNIITSEADSDDWKYNTDTANNFDWKISWTLPVQHHNGDLLAFITIFADKAVSPSKRDINTLERLRNLLRILLANHLSLDQIRLSNERYDNVLKATHDLVWDWNLETGSFYRNIEGLKKVYGVSSHEAIQNVYSWMERIHPEDHAEVQQVINDILHATDQDTFDVEYRFKKDDGEYSFIYDRGIIVRNAEGKPLRMIGAAQNVTDRKKLEQELLENELDLQKSISQATIDTQEQERREIGKELHDNVNQVLTTTKLYLDLSLSSPELKDDLIKKSSKNVIYVINEIRQLSRSLMDPSIGDLGLIDSINDLVENINITRKLHVSLSADPELEKHVDESQKLMIFRILQEAMNNTIKYAQATSVQLNIKHKKGQVELVIIDDGIGFNPQTVKKGAGLKNIQNRVYLTGGKLSIESSAGKGCKIVIHFPINKKQKSK